MTSKTRVPAGVPTGGRFSPQAHDEGDVDLRQQTTGSQGAPSSPVERSEGVIEDRNWNPSLSLNEAGLLRPSDEALLVDYDQWQVRVVRLNESEDLEDLDDLNDEMGHLVHDMANTGRFAARPPVIEDPDWRPAAIFVRPQNADGPSLDELFADYDQWQVRADRLSAEGSGEEVDDLNNDMRYLVHEVAHRMRLTTGQAAA